MSSSPKNPRRRKPSAKKAGAKKPSAKKAGAKRKRPSVRSGASRPAAKSGRKTASKARTKRARGKRGAARAAPRRRRQALPKSVLIPYPLDQHEDFAFQSVLPLLPLRDVVIFPGMIVPLFVGRPGSVVAVEHAVSADKVFAAITQREPQESEPKPEDLYDVGVILRALQVLRMPDGTIKILVEAVCRVNVERIVWATDHYRVAVELWEPPVRETSELKALSRSVATRFQEYVELNKRIPDEVVAALGDAHDPRRVANVTSGHLMIELADRQALLASADLHSHLIRLSEILTEELEILRIEQKIEGEVKSQVFKGQKEFYLQEQLKAIRKELGESAAEDQDTEELREAVEKSGMPAEVRKKALTEVQRLARMSPMSPEATVVRTYVETLTSLPWRKRTRDRLDLDRAQDILDEDHYGLEKIKERILEYLAVVKLAKRLRGSILCLVGPPGVGKTSLGRSVARALGRKFVRMSLGGVRDEAEIRGHRRTYIGSMPGRIVQGIRKAGTKNPVFLLDEVDKLSSDFRGDPSAALLEVLDPEQNHAFNDHYLEADFDLSEVMFITTGNVLPAILPALRDRMEVLRLPGYLKHEKEGIARKFLIPKQLAAHGIVADDLTISEEALKLLITRYTREAGVRNLEREIASLCRKAARAKVGGARGKIRIGAKTLKRYLGPPRYPERRLPPKDRIGVASGLAWTEYGGDVLPVEVTVLPGTGKLSLTGRLGEVMRESAQTALTHARSRAGVLGLSPDFSDQLDVHMHMPEGAIPKDGPSAGVCIATAVVSALTRVAVRRDVAMTGEITLLGEVLAVGGLNEKVVAASLAGYTRLILPRQNEPDWLEIPAEAKRGLKVNFVDRVDDVLRIALAPSGVVERLKSAKEHGLTSDGLPGLAAH